MYCSGAASPAFAATTTVYPDAPCFLSVSVNYATELAFCPIAT